MALTASPAASTTASPTASTGGSSPYVTRDGTPIRIGQIWEDTDYRMNGRRCEVVGMEGCKVIMRVVVSSVSVVKLTRISVHRFGGNRRPGWRLICVRGGSGGPHDAMILCTTYYTVEYRRIKGTSGWQNACEGVAGPWRFTTEENARAEVAQLLKMQSRPLFEYRVVRNTREVLP